MQVTHKIPCDRYSQRGGLFRLSLRTGECLRVRLIMTFSYYKRLQVKSTLTHTMKICWSTCHKHNQWRF